MKKRVLVTGASGFIGSHSLPTVLDLGYEVHAVARRAPPVRGDIEWHEADLFEADSTRRLIETVRPTHLLHLAWCTEPGAYWTSPENDRWLEASLRLARDFAAPRRRFVGVGTSAEYDWSHGVLVENVTPLDPATPYGKAKLALHLGVTEIAAAAGMSVAWARLFGVYGPGEPPQKLVSRVVSDLLAGRPFRGRAPADARDFLYVADAGRALAMLLDSSVEGAVNVGSGRSVTVREVVTTIADILQRPGLVQPDERPSGEAPLVVADVRRLREVIGFTPAYTLEEGIRTTIEWHRRTGGVA